MSSAGVLASIYNTYYMSQSVWYGEIFHEQADLFSWASENKAWEWNI